MMMSVEGWARRFGHRKICEFDDERKVWLDNAAQEPESREFRKCYWMAGPGGVTVEFGAELTGLNGCYQVTMRLTPNDVALLFLKTFSWVPLARVLRRLLPPEAGTTREVGECKP